MYLNLIIQTNLFLQDQIMLLRNLKCSSCGHNGRLVNTCYVNLNQNVSKFKSNASYFGSNVNDSKNFHGKKKLVEKKVVHVHRPIL